LILDNCEHVIDEAARFTAAALTTAPRIWILATSQVPLGLSGEVEWLVPSLDLPEEGAPENLERLRTFAAIQLFIERAASARAGFSLTRENAPAIIEICRRLDGIPLAIELAAARIKIFSAAEIAARLDQRFSLLASAKRDVHFRHRTLAAALDWSYTLLTSEEQLLLAWLSIFRGPWTLADAEAVCSAEGALCSAEGVDQALPFDLFDLISHLIDRSFVVAAGMPAEDETHYRLLETVRLFGLAHLTAGDRARLEDQLLAWCDELTARECAQVHGPRQVEIVRLIQREQPNLTAAIDWALLHPAPDQRLLQGLHVAAATSWPMRISGRAETSNAWLEKLLAAAGEMDSGDWIRARADGQVSLSRGYWYISAYTPSYELAQSALALYQRLGDAARAGQLNARQLMLMSSPSPEYEHFFPLFSDLLADFQAIGDRRGELETYLHIAIRCHVTGQYDRAVGYFQQALQIAHGLGNVQFTGLCSRQYSWTLVSLDRWPEAFAQLEEAQRCFETLGFVNGLNFVQLDLGNLAFMRGMLAQAEEYYRISIPISERSGTRSLKRHALYKLGLVALRHGQAQASEEHFRAADDLFRRVIFDFPALEEPEMVAHALRALAALCAQEDPRQAARMDGHAQRLAEDLNYQELIDPVVVNPRLEAARAALGEAEYQRCAEQGAKMSIPELLAGSPPPVTPAPAGPSPSARKTPAAHLTPLQTEKARYSGLTSREREVALFIAQGKSNLAIARQMMLSERTITTHITHILEKLGYSSRTQIAAWAVEKGLFVVP
jgi:predicted ATPase/DNA-binding CsgD family transcriptional regulator